MSVKRNEYYLLLNGETSGPHTLEELHQLWLAEKITLDTLYVQPGMQECKPVNLILNRVIGFRKDEPQAEQPAPEIAVNRRAVVVGFYCAAAIVIGMLVWVYITMFRTDDDPALRFNAGAQLTMTHLSIINRNDYDWTNVNVVLNGKPPAGYKCLVPSIRGGGYVDLSLIDFVDEKNFRFEPWRTTVDEIWVGDEKRGYRPVPVPRR
ncbi:MAG: DUF4339 domain-containing protein [Verrucomicrobiota bacterium]